MTSQEGLVGRGRLGRRSGRRSTEGRAAATRPEARGRTSATSVTSAPRLAPGLLQGDARGECEGLAGSMCGQPQDQLGVRPRREAAGCFYSEAQVCEETGNGEQSLRGEDSASWVRAGWAGQLGAPQWPEERPK